MGCKPTRCAEIWPSHDTKEGSNRVLSYGGPSEGLTYSSVRGMKKMHMGLCRPMSSLFLLTSVCGSHQESDKDITYYEKGTREGALSDYAIILSKLNAKLNVLSRKTNSLTMENVNLKAVVANNSSWLKDVSSLPLLAFFDMVRIYLNVLNKGSRDLVQSSACDSDCRI